MPQLISFVDVSKQLGPKHIFTEASVGISAGQKIGVIGRNGCGKTTFFKMLLGELEPDLGEIHHHPTLKIGYVPQQDPFEKDETVIAFLMRYTGRADWDCRKIAKQFEIDDTRIEKTISNLSGGYQMRVKLAATLLFEPNLLLLDEPTNYLDLKTLLLLEQFLRGYQGGYLCISHDRTFIRKTCTSILEIADGKMILHNEGIDEYESYKKEKEGFASVVNENIEKKQKQLKDWVGKFGAKANFASMAQNKLKQIERLEEEKLAVVDKQDGVRIWIPKVDAREGYAVMLSKAEVGYGEKTVLKNVDFTINRGEKVAVLGDNGEGKSTLMKTMVGEIEALAGSVKCNPYITTSYYGQHSENSMYVEQTVWEYMKITVTPDIREEDISRMLGNFLFKKQDYEKRIKVLSGGEKARLAMSAMFLSKSDMFFLDEPTNHLDYDSVQALADALGEFNGTVVVISHDRDFVQAVATRILLVEKGQAKFVFGNYTDYVAQLEASVISRHKDDAVDAPKQFVLPDKERRKRIYELQKTLKSLERKIEKFKQDPLSVKNFTEVEEEWLGVTEELAALGVIK
jgi:ATP-binding cassette, subfamily F, member 3